MSTRHKEVQFSSQKHRHWKKIKWGSGGGKKYKKL